MHASPLCCFGWRGSWPLCRCGQFMNMSLGSTRCSSRRKCSQAVLHCSACTADALFPLIRRTRVCSVIARRSNVEIISDIADTYSKLCLSLRARSVQPAISSCFVAREDEILDFEIACRKRKGLSPTLVPSLCWKYLLTEKQLEFLQRYECLWVQRTSAASTDESVCVFDLIQNPKERPSLTSKSGSLPTLRHSGSCFWSSFLGRWLLPRELAAASGFPVTGSLAAVSSVAIDTNSYSNQQLGNAMHVATVGTVVAVKRVLNSLPRPVPQFSMLRRWRCSQDKSLILPLCNICFRRPICKLAKIVAHPRMLLVVVPGRAPEPNDA